jgi:hypothetical protein
MGAHAPITTVKVSARDSMARAGFPVHFSAVLRRTSALLENTLASQPGGRPCRQNVRGRDGWNPGSSVQPAQPIAAQPHRFRGTPLSAIVGRRSRVSRINIADALAFGSGCEDESSRL